MEFDRLLLRLGRHLRAARRSLGLSQDSAAARAGIDPKFLQRIERGKQAITLRTLHRLARALRTTVAALLVERDEIAPSPAPPRVSARDPDVVSKNRDGTSDPSSRVGRPTGFDGMPSRPVPYPWPADGEAALGRAADRRPRPEARLAPPLGRPTSRELHAFLAAFGQRCRAVRIARGLRPVDLRAAGWTRQYLNRVESGRGVTITTLLRLAAAYGVEPADLLPPRPIGSARSRRRGVRR